MQFFSILCILISGLTSLLCFIAILIVQKFSFFYLLPAAFLIILPLISKRTAVLVFTLSLPFFGNRPGSDQTYYLFFIAASLNLGLYISIVRSWRDFLGSLNYKNPILFLSSLYLVVSAFSLTSLPISEFYLIFKSQLLSVKDLSALSYVLMNLISATEDRLAYSFLSVIWTAFSYNLMLIVCYLGIKNKLNIAYTIYAILAGLLICLTAGLLDYYSIINLSWMRTLDPVVNPGGIQFRMQSFFGHSGWFAEYVTLCIPFTLIVLRLPLRFSLRLAAIIFILLLGEFSLILSFQRGGWVSYPLTLLIVWASIYVYQKLQSTDLSFISALRGSVIKIAVSIPLTLAATILIFYSLSSLGLINEDKGRIISRYADRFTDITRSSDRTDFMKAGFKLGSLYPLLGGGSESFAYRFNKEFNQPDGAFYKQLELPLYGSSHNVYMQTFSGKGMAGLVLLLSIIGYTIISSFKLVLYDKFHSLDERIYLLSVASFCFAFLIYGNVQELFYVQVLQFLFFIILGLVAALQSNFLDLSTKSRTNLASAILVLIACHFFWLYYTGEKSPSEGYGCFNSETDVKGKQYRWCSPNSRVPTLISENGVNYKVKLSIETGHFKYMAGGKDLKIYNSDKLVFEQTIEPLQRYNLEFEIPKTVATEATVRDNSNFLNLSIITGNYFIPMRDLPNSDDFRVLAFKLYNP